jgi:hypothetical protein
VLDHERVTARDHLAAEFLYPLQAVVVGQDAGEEPRRDVLGLRVAFPVLVEVDAVTRQRYRFALASIVMKFVYRNSCL